MTITIVLIEPIKTRKDSFDHFLDKEDAITAACDAPIPGNNPVIVDAKVPREIDFAICFLGRLMGVFFCFGIFVLFWILITNVEIPNNPESIGRSGWDKVSLKTAKPKEPDSKKMKSAWNFDLSFIIRKNEQTIKIYGIEFFIKS